MALTWILKVESNKNYSIIPLMIEGLQMTMPIRRLEPFSKTEMHFNNLNISHRRHSQLSIWKDMNPADIKIFSGNLFVMCSVNEPALHNYW